MLNTTAQPATTIPMTELLITDARLDGQRVDIHIADGAVRELRPHTGARGDVQAEGRWLLPGLWDEHVHLSQWAMTVRRVNLSTARSAAEAVKVIAPQVTGSTDTLIGAHFRDANWPDQPSLEALDAVSDNQPVVLVSGDLHSCWLNSAALARYDVREHDGGLIREAEAFRVEQALESVDQATLDGWARDAVQAAAARGVVGIVDFEMRDNIADWQRRAALGPLPVRVDVGIYTDRLEAALAAGYRTGQPLDADGLVRVGWYKVITDGSLNTRTAWCFEPYGGSTGVANVDFDELTELVRRASQAGIQPAIHAIGDRANARVLDLYEQLGLSGRIEHAQLLRWQDVARFARLGIVASIQPEHAMDDRDVADHYWHDRADRAFVLRSLDEAGVQLAFGSDAPVAPLDPWQGMAAAVFRARDARKPWHAEQCLSFERALLASTRQRAAVRVGDVADLILTERDPATATEAELRTMPVALTLLAGRITHSAV